MKALTYRAKRTPSSPSPGHCTRRAGRRRPSCNTRTKNCEPKSCSGSYASTEKQRSGGCRASQAKKASAAGELQSIVSHGRVCDADALQGRRALQHRRAAQQGAGAGAQPLQAAQPWAAGQWWRVGGALGQLTPVLQDAQPQAGQAAQRGRQRVQARCGKQHLRKHHRNGSVSCGVGHAAWAVRRLEPAALTARPAPLTRQVRPARCCRAPSTASLSVPYESRCCSCVSADSAAKGTPGFQASQAAAKR